MQKVEETKTIFQKNQGPIAGMRQAAMLLGGQLVTDQQGFLVNYANGQAPLSINAGTDTE